MPKTKILKARINFISLCPRGANRLPVIYKSDEDLVRFDPILKTNMEKGEILAVVYAPNIVDAHGDYADSDTIREMAHEFSRYGKGIDIRHDGNALSKEQAHIAESFIIQKGDPRFTDMKDYSGDPVDVTGGWGIVIKIEDESLRKSYREGQWQGVSMAGIAITQAEKSGQGVFDMTEDQLKAALAEANKGVVTGVVDGLKSVFKEAGVIKDKPADTKKPKNPAPVFKGDWAKEADVQKYLKAVKVYKLMEDNDASTPDGALAIAEGMQEIEKEHPTLSEDGKELTEIEKQAGCAQTDTREVRDLKVRLRKAQGGSNQTITKSDEDMGDDNFLGATDKNEQDAIKLARGMAKEDYGAPAKA